MTFRNLIPAYRTAALVLAVLAFGPAARGAANLEARVRIGKQRHRIILLGRRDGMVLFRYADSGSAATAAMKPQDISRLRIRIEYDRDAYTKARRRQEWATAGTVLAKALAPALQFVDIKNNNVVSPAIRAAKCFMRAGSVKTGCHWEIEGRANGQREYQLANALLQAAMKAEWSARADTAALMSSICLVALGKADDAAALLENLSVPDTADDEYGLHRLARATLLVERRQYVEAIEQAVDGIAFETKDIDTFPDSLMLSAYCYGKLGNWYRARDVYYEIARLFSGTHWEIAAREHLKTIVDEALTKEDEAVAVENVFFGIEENMNEKVATLLNPEKDPPSRKKETDPK